ncbi:HASPIN protein kinase [Edhazardia aedis USNM 41457]|uniref:non-specific serine/threonine protein kinase n=1 Tax=Edhazardia aedis (strain USNM 41457) TaxID=1003232 RepID=J9D8R3_EDHAE|nr:HASPIN protein kinase [Edhazardia aedis USNM 41457]|eukprot:EJW04141.1 HASPIN protein kinase [Edhazardia aedis USNM 41457]
MKINTYSKKKRSTVENSFSENKKMFAVLKNLIKRKNDCEHCVVKESKDGMRVSNVSDDVSKLSKMVNDGVVSVFDSIREDGDKFDKSIIQKKTNKKKPKLQNDRSKEENHNVCANIQNKSLDEEKKQIDNLNLCAELNLSNLDLKRFDSLRNEENICSTELKNGGKSVKDEDLDINLQIAESSSRNTKIKSKSAKKYRKIVSKTVYDDFFVNCSTINEIYDEDNFSDSIVDYSVERLRKNSKNDKKMRKKKSVELVKFSRNFGKNFLKVDRIKVQCKSSKKKNAVFEAQQKNVEKTGKSDINCVLEEIDENTNESVKIKDVFDDKSITCEDINISKIENRKKNNEDVKVKDGDKSAACDDLSISEIANNEDMNLSDLSENKKSIMVNDNVKETARKYETTDESNIDTINCEGSLEMQETCELSQHCTTIYSENASTDFAHESNDNISLEQDFSANNLEDLHRENTVEEAKEGKSILQRDDEAKRDDSDSSSEKQDKAMKLEEKTSKQISSKEINDFYNSLYNSKTKIDVCEIIAIKKTSKSEEAKNYPSEAEHVASEITNETYNCDSLNFLGEKNEWEVTIDDLNTLADPNNNWITADDGKKEFKRQNETKYEYVEDRNNRGFNHKQRRKIPRNWKCLSKNGDANNYKNSDDKSFLHARKRFCGSGDKNTNVFYNAKHGRNFEYNDNECKFENHSDFGTFNADYHYNSSKTFSVNNSASNTSHSFSYKKDRGKSNFSNETKNVFLKNYREDKNIDNNVSYGMFEEKKGEFDKTQTLNCIDDGSGILNISQTNKSSKLESSDTILINKILDSLENTVANKQKSDNLKSTLNHETKIKIMNTRMFGSKEDIEIEKNAIIDVAKNRKDSGSLVLEELDKQNSLEVEKNISSEVLNNEKKVYAKCVESKNLDKNMVDNNVDSSIVQSNGYDKECNTSDSLDLQTMKEKNKKVHAVTKKTKNIDKNVDFKFVESKYINGEYVEIENTGDEQNKEKIENFAISKNKKTGNQTFETQESSINTYRRRNTSEQRNRLNIDYRNSVSERGYSDYTVALEEISRRMATNCINKVAMWNYLRRECDRYIVNNDIKEAITKNDKNGFTREGLFEMVKNLYNSEFKVPSSVYNLRDKYKNSSVVSDNNIFNADNSIEKTEKSSFFSMKKLEDNKKAANALNEVVNNKISPKTSFKKDSLSFSDDEEKSEYEESETIQSEEISLDETADDISFNDDSELPFWVNNPYLSQKIPKRYNLISDDQENETTYILSVNNILEGSEHENSFFDELFACNKNNLCFNDKNKELVFKKMLLNNSKVMELRNDIVCCLLRAAKFDHNFYFNDLYTSNISNTKNSNDHKNTYSNSNTRTNHNTNNIIDNISNANYNKMNLLNYQSSKGDYTTNKKNSNGHNNIHNNNLVKLTDMIELEDDNTIIANNGLDKKTFDDLSISFFRSDNIEKESILEDDCKKINNSQITTNISEKSKINDFLVDFQYETDLAKKKYIVEKKLSEKNSKNSSLLSENHSSLKRKINNVFIKPHLSTDITKENLQSDKVEKETAENEEKNQNTPIKQHKKRGRRRKYPIEIVEPQKVARNIEFNDDVHKFLLNDKSISKGRHRAFDLPDGLSSLSPNIFDMYYVYPVKGSVCKFRFVKKKNKTSLHNDFPDKSITDSCYYNDSAILSHQNTSIASNSHAKINLNNLYNNNDKFNLINISNMSTISNNINVMAENNLISNQIDSNIATNEEMKKILELRRILQADLITENIKKINEATFSDVFYSEKHETVIKVVHLNDVDTDLFIKECLINRILTKEHGIIETLDTYKYFGRLPKEYFRAWETYKNIHGEHALNHRPENTKQMYGFLLMKDGGKDLEKFIFRDLFEILCFILEIIKIIYNLEKKYKFEHRDLHWGNILISRKTESKIFDHKNTLDFISSNQKLSDDIQLIMSTSNNEHNNIDLHAINGLNASDYRDNSKIKQFSVTLPIKTNDYNNMSLFNDISRNQQSNSIGLSNNKTYYLNDSEIALNSAFLKDKNIAFKRLFKELKKSIIYAATKNNKGKLKILDQSSSAFIPDDLDNIKSTDSTSKKILQSMSSVNNTNIDTNTNTTNNNSINNNTSTNFNSIDNSINTINNNNTNTNNFNSINNNTTDNTINNNFNSTDNTINNNTINNNTINNIGKLHNKIVDKNLRLNEKTSKINISTNNIGDINILSYSTDNINNTNQKFASSISLPTFNQSKNQYDNQHEINNNTDLNDNINIKTYTLSKKLHKNFSKSQDSFLTKDNKSAIFDKIANSLDSILNIASINQINDDKIYHQKSSYKKIQYPESFFSKKRKISNDNSSSKSNLKIHQENNIIKKEIKTCRLPFIYDKNKKYNPLNIRIIDFTLSRLEFQNKIIYSDLNNKEWLFEGDDSIDIQYTVYKKMKTDDWSKFNPKSNFLWLKYLVNKIEEKCGKNSVCNMFYKIFEKTNNIDQVYNYIYKNE